MDKVTLELEVDLTTGEWVIVQAFETFPEGYHRKLNLDYVGDREPYIVASSIIGG